MPSRRACVRLRYVEMVDAAAQRLVLDWPPVVVGPRLIGLDADVPWVAKIRDDQRRRIVETE